MESLNMFNTLLCKKNTVAAAVVSVIFMGGCSSNAAVDDYQAHQQEVQAKKFEAQEEAFQSIPEWFFKPPQNDSSGVYAVGTASSTNLQFSMNQAKLNAEFSIAKTLNQEVSGRERSFMSSDSKGNVQTDAESVVTKFVDSADIVGVSTVDSHFEHHEGKYTVYTLLHLSYDQQAEILSRKVKSETKLSAKEAYKEIEAELRRRSLDRNSAIEKLEQIKKPITATPDDSISVGKS